MPLIWQMRRKVKKYYLLVLRKVNSNKSIVKGQVIVSFAIRSCITEKNEIVEVYLWKKTFSQGGNSFDGPRKYIWVAVFNVCSYTSPLGNRSYNGFFNSVAIFY